MLNRSDSSDGRRQRLSALMDGELPPDAVAGACAQWHVDPSDRQDWHAYHLIGDVLRSDELAVPPARDEAFLQALRLRLADEPVPLAPALPQVPPEAGRPRLPQVANGATVSGFMPGAGAAGVAVRQSRSWWMAPIAVAAGFVAVAGVMVVTRLVSSEPAGAVLAAARPATGAASAVLVRNAQLDRYLSAHRALASGAMPGAGAEQRVYIVFEGQ